MPSLADTVRTCSGLILTSIGGGIGLVASATLMRLIRSFIFAVSPLDPFTYAAAPLILAPAAALASYIPALHAAAVDPAETLKAK